MKMRGIIITGWAIISPFRCHSLSWSILVDANMRTTSSSAIPKNVIYMRLLFNAVKPKLESKYILMLCSYKYEFMSTVDAMYQ